MSSEKMLTEARKMVDDGKILAVEEMRELYPEPRSVSLAFAFRKKDTADVFLFPDADPDCYVCEPASQNEPCVHVLAAGIWKARFMLADESKIRHREKKRKEEKKRRGRTEWKEAV